MWTEREVMKTSEDYFQTLQVLLMCACALFGLEGSDYTGNLDATKRLAPAHRDWFVDLSLLLDARRLPADLRGALHF